jgi:hypothetical protein
MTAGTFSLLQITNSRYLTLNGKLEEAMAQVATWKDLREQATAFIFIHQASRDKVLTAVETGRESFMRDAAHAVTLPSEREVAEAAQKIGQMFFRTFAEGDEPLRQANDGNPLSAQKDSGWLSSYLVTLAGRTGWSYEFILWELPLSVGVSMLRCIFKTAHVPLPQSESSEEKLFEQLEAELKGAARAQR